MTGNASEWVSSWFAPYPYDPADGREGGSGYIYRVRRGGDFDDDARAVVLFERNRFEPGLADNDKNGLRCARDFMPGDLDASSSSSANIPERIAFTSMRDGNLEIYVMNADGSNMRRLTDHRSADYGPRVSPDGTQVVFYSGRDGDTELYLVNVDGSDLRQLTDHDAIDANPAWSPDGESIAFMSDRDNEFGAIYIINADGHGLRQLMEGGGDNSPSWSPDGALIVFESLHDSPEADIYIGAVDGSDVRRLTTDAASDKRPVWSPDGSEIVFMSNRDGDFEIYLMDADGENVRQLTDNEVLDMDATWSRDGSQIRFVSDRDGERRFYVMNADGSRQRLDIVFLSVDQEVVQGGVGPTGRLVQVAADQTINVRSGADTVFAIIGTLAPGETAILTSESADGSWLNVTLGDGTTGWVSAALVNEVSPPVTPTE